MRTVHGFVVVKGFSKKTRVVWTALLLSVLVGMFGCGGGGGDDSPTSPALGSSGATLHAILCIADHESDIGAGTVVDMNNISALLDKISQNTGMPLNKIVITGTSGNLNSAFLTATINNLAVGADDVVMFYYSGHGGANENAGGSRWPLMVFSESDLPDFAQVSESIRARGPRFVLTMADCCNNYSWQAKTAPIVPRGSQDAYSALFLTPRGHLYMSAASPGEFSLGGDDGGMFTNQFLLHFYAQVDAGNSDWSSIVQKGTVEVQNMDPDTGEVTVFHPQYDLSI